MTPPPAQACEDDQSRSLANDKILVRDTKLFESIGANVAALLKNYEENALFEPTVAPAWYRQHFKDGLQATAKIFEKTAFKVPGTGQLSPISWFKKVNRAFNSERDRQLVAYRRGYLVAIIGLMWHIRAQAAKKGDHFLRGSYVIRDPEQVLYRFLLRYVAVATGYQDPEHQLASWSMPGFGWGNSFAYNRNPEYKHSSHFTRSRLKSLQWGIDMRLAGDGDVHAILPGAATHLLFGNLQLPEGDKLTFVKFEEFGVGSLQDAFFHLYMSVFALNPYAERPEGSRREKDVAPEVLAVFSREQSSYDSQLSLAENSRQLSDNGKQELGEVCAKLFNEADFSFRSGSESTLTQDDLGI